MQFKIKTPKEILIVFHNSSTYDYHFITNKLAKALNGQLECLRENTEKYITFSVPISKKLDNGKTITYRWKFIDSFRFRSTLLSSLVNNLSEIYRYKNVEIKTANEHAILLGLKIIHYVTNAKNVKKSS